MTQSNGQERTLVKKMAEIMQEVGYIPKTGYNQHNNYNYVQEADVLDALRDKMAARNLMIFPDIVEKDVIEIGAAKSGAKKFLTSIKVQFTIVDGDSGEERIITSAGQGEDTGDKGVYKAMTGCNKYALLKLFMIPTGDDPENDGGQQQNGSQNNNKQPQGGGKGQGNSRGSQNNQKPQQGGNKAPESVEAPPNKSVMDLKEMLGWTDKQMLDNINAYREKSGAAPVKRYADMDNEWKAAFYNLMLRIFDKQIGGQK